MNAKYTTLEEIYARVTSLVKSKSINPADVVDWAIQCETEWIENYNSYVRYLKAKFVVSDYMVRIPPYKVRVLDVFEDPDKNSSRVQYYDNGSYLVLSSTYKKDHVYVNFIGLAIDEETGLPMIHKGSEEACVAHVIHNLFYEDYLNNNIDQGRYNTIAQTRDLQVRAAKSSFAQYDRQELREVLAISLNLTPHIVLDSFMHHRFGE